MATISRIGVQQKLTLAITMAVLLAAALICASLYYFNKKRSYDQSIQHSNEMAQATTLAFSQALSLGDEIFLDALLHELISREELHIQEAYVLNVNGKVLAHSNTVEYGKTYPLPYLLKQPQPSSLSQIKHGENDYQVVSLLQNKGNTIGGLVLRFSISHLNDKIRSEMFWIIGTTVPVLVLTAIIVMFLGRRMVSRLKRLQEKVVDIGCGSINKPIEVTGRDEISDLTQAFNQMQRDLIRLRSKDQSSLDKISSLNEELSEQLTKVKQLKEQLDEENAALRRELGSVKKSGNIIGEETGLRDVIDKVYRLASLPVTVLITGESGTGKELLATLLHKQGLRKEAPFVTVNCAALPINLIESELFGHEKGAFTDAVAQKKGKFELAHGGTLFLDEVGELPIEAQAKLLRALQENEIYRVGGQKSITIDIRVIAATNKDLADEVSHGRFREDLYYRLRVVEIHAPPLRERLEDLPALSQHFIDHYCKKLNKPVKGISASALKFLVNYYWPGNIRELENTLARAVALATTKILGMDDFTFIANQSVDPTTSNVALNPDSSFHNLLNACGLQITDIKHEGWGKLMDGCERVCLQSMLDKHKNQKETAGALGLSVTKMHRLIKKHNLRNRN